MSSSISVEAARVESIIEKVIDDLRGVATEVDTIEPRRRFCVGVLTPPHADADQIGATRKRRRSPESIGFSARVSPEEMTLAGVAEGSFSLWYRVLPTYEQQQRFIGASKQSSYQLEPIYARHDVSFSELPFHVDLNSLHGRIPADTVTANAKLSTIIAQARQAILNGRDGTRIYPGAAKLNLKPEDMISTEAFRAAVSGAADLPNWVASLEASIVETADGPRLTLTLSNRTLSAKQHQAELFDAKLLVRLTKGTFQAREFHGDRLEDRYESRSWGRGINAVLEINPERPTEARANTTPRYKQRRLGHRSDPSFTSPRELASENALSSLESLLAHLRRYQSNWARSISESRNDAKRATASSDLQAFTDEIASIELGVLALRTDPRLLMAFRHMNEAVSMQGTEAKPFVWRPFQIAFIVCVMPSLLARENPDEKWIAELERVDLLWFPTGGGKSEATFGIILAALFYDRLRGKEFGVTAWMRYPLRMLSIQQLQRLVEFIVSGEIVRQRAKIGGDPFSVGYYVGEQNTPNRLTDKRNTNAITLYKARVLRDGGSFLRILQSCPFRDCRDRKRIDVQIDDSIEVIRIFHKCGSCGRTAPIYISDSEIYRYLPGVLVGTVDRLARAGQTDEFSHLYGQVDSKCPQHGYARHKTCIEAGCNLTKRAFETIEAPYDPVPALLIQDELHLLKEALGTYDSHFEGFLDAFACEVGKKLVPKRIAATATVEGFERHVRELYGLGRTGRRFPARGPSELESAYVMPDDDNRLSRVFVGILPNGLTSDQVCARIARAVSELAIAREVEDVKASLSAQYDVSLIYANTKDSLGNIGAELKRELPLLRTLSGERSLEEVRKIIDELQDDVEKPLEKRIPAIIATSIISHGVDVARLNVMAFSAFPGKAADYIQSSSRVGRSHEGVVFLVCDPTRTIDRSTFAHFHEYHERLYALVQPVPIIRFSESAVRRTFTGIFSASLINTLNSTKDGDLGQGRKAAASLVSGIPSEIEMVEAVSASYGLEKLNDDLRAKYKSLLGRLSQVAISQVINNSEDWASSSRLRPKPIASLREVQESVGFDVTPRRHREVQTLKRSRS